MPDRSKAQMRKMFVLEREGKVKPGTAVEWARETPKVSELPEYVSKPPKRGREKFAVVSSRPARPAAG